MEDDVLDALESLGYEGPLKSREALQDAIKEGPKSIEYTMLVEWLSKELKVLGKLEDHINAISNTEEASSFMLEVSSFLKEISCPYSCLTEGNLSQRLETEHNRLLLLVFLSTELEAARMIAVNSPETCKGMEVEVQESPTANDLKTMLVALGFSKPPENITPQQLFTKVEAKVQDNLKKLPPKLISTPLFTGVLSENQWNILDRVHDDMMTEYQLRREMLLKRLDVTIQSFQWSGKAKSRSDDIIAQFGTKRRHLPTRPNVNLGDLLAAREDLTILEKTSNANVRKNTQSSINKVMIGRVPDRGGRPSEQQAPPPEMPSWQKRTDGPSGRGGRGGGRGGGGDRGGGRVQGGWAGGGGGYGGGGGGGHGGGGGGGGHGGGGGGGHGGGGGGYGGGGGGGHGGGYGSGNGRGGGGGGGGGHRGRGGRGGGGREGHFQDHRGGGGYGSGQQYGQGYGSGQQYGQVHGSGQQYGQGHGSGLQYAQGYGSDQQCGQGYGSGQQYGQGYGSSQQYGQGYGSGQQYGQGYGYDAAGSYSYYQ